MKRNIRKILEIIILLIILTVIVAITLNKYLKQENQNIEPINKKYESIEIKNNLDSVEIKNIDKKDISNSEEIKVENNEIENNEADNKIKEVIFKFIEETSKSISNISEKKDNDNLKISEKLNEEKIDIEEIKEEKLIEEIESIKKVTTEIENSSDDKSILTSDKKEFKNISESENKKEMFLNTTSKIYSELGDKNYLTTLKKGTRVRVTENSEVEKIVKSKKGEKDKIIKIIYSKIIYRDINGEKIAWIRNNFLTKERKYILPKNIDDIEINIREKKEYPNNKRIKVRGFYVSSKTLTLEKRTNELIKLAKEKGINTFVIDVKEDFGKITFPVSNEVEKYSKISNKKPDIKDIQSIMKKLKENNIYTIARIVSFKDPIYAKENPNKIITYKTTGKPFTNKDNLTWVSPHDRKLWEYNIFVAKEAAKVGFNEIQFDYVRFPASDGGKLDILLDYKNLKGESKAKTIQKYLEYAKKELEPLGVYISADIYGQVGSVEDDMSLGQYWEAISSETDYISPMIYPSHYGKGVYGLSVPDANPYKTVYYSTRDSVNRNNNIENPAIIRPWIQAFTAKWVNGHIKYGPQEIKEQIKAMKDAGIDEYILWSPTNRYESYF